MNKKLFKQNLRNTIKSMSFMIRFVWKEFKGKVYIISKIVLALLNALLPLSYVFFPGLLINELSGDKRINLIILFIGLTVGLPFLGYLVNTLMGKHIYKLEMTLDLKFDSDFYYHIATMDYETLENPDIQILKGRAQNTIGQSLSVVDQVCEFFASLCGLIAIFSIIFALNPLFIILIIAVAYINSVLLKHSNNKGYEIGKELSKYDRLTGSYVYKLNHFEYAKEIRLFDLSKLLLDGFVKIYSEKNAMALKQYMIGKKYGILTSAVNLIQHLVMYIYIVYEVLFRGLSIGNMTIYTGVVAQFSGALNRLTGAYLTLSRMSLDVQEMEEFMKIPSNSKMGKLKPVFDNHSIIEFRNVSFKYPGSDRYALQNVNLIIQGNEKLCIVGLNGAGKTTLIKLLTRLYLPNKGKILLNGVNINEYDYKMYQRLFAPVFQDFKLYNMLSLGNNVVLGQDYDPNKLDAVCLKSGLKSLVDKLSKGYDALPSKYIDEEGFEPSGGEGQRIAIARACYREGEVYLLDEPTAALDPMAEYEIYTQFNDMIADKCAILITHRLSAVQLADKVAVFDNGHVAEYGTHTELYAKSGIYTEMFDKQAQFYRDAPEKAETAEV